MTFALRTVFLSACLGASQIALSQQVGPAPRGDAKKVANRVIKEAEHPCPTVSSAARLSDGGIVASCSNGERYLIFSVNGEAVAMRCSAARKIGVNAC